MRTHPSQIFLRILLCCIGGVALRSFVSIPYGLTITGFLAGASAVVMGVRRKNRSWICCGLLLIGFFAGITRFDLATHAYPYIASLGRRSVIVRGVVWTEPIVGLNSETLQVRVRALNDRGARTPFMLRVVNKKYPAYEIGDELTIRGVVQDEDDPASSPRKEPVMLFPAIKKTKAPNQRPVMHALAEVKHAFKEKIDRALPEPHSAFLKGLLLGERASLPADLLESFKKTGTSHMIALSGYNITIIGRSLASLLVMLTVPFYASFWVALGAMVLFVVMTGASASAVRAGIIAVLALVAHREGRPYQMTNALAFAGAAMLMLDPTLLRFNVGFQLSFLATMGLVYLSPGIERKVERALDFLKRSIGNHPASRAVRSGNADATLPVFLTMKRLLIETLAAELAVLPLLIYLFGYLSIVSPLANIAVLLVVPYAMGAGFFMAIAGFVSSLLGSATGGITWLLLGYITTVVAFFAAFPYATVELGAWGAFGVLAIYGAIGWKVYQKRH